MDKAEQAAEDAQFESGYTDDATPTETPASSVAKPESNAAPESASTQAAASVEPAAVDPLAALQAQMEKFQQGHDKLAGHIGNLTRTTKEISDRLATGNAAARAVNDAPNQSQVQAAAASPAKWEALRTDFPEWASATDEMVDAKIAARSQSEVEAINRAVAQQLQGQTASMRKEIVSSTLDVVLENWEDEVKTPAFGKWLDAQPDTVKALAKSDKVGDAARMLKLYDKARQAPAKPAPAQSKTVDARKERLQAAIAPRGSGGTTTTRTDLDEFEAGYSG